MSESNYKVEKVGNGYVVADYKRGMYADQTGQWFFTPSGASMHPFPTEEDAQKFIDGLRGQPGEL